MQIGVCRQFETNPYQPDALRFADSLQQNIIVFIFVYRICNMYQIYLN